MDCSLPGFSIHGIVQARVRECGAIAFSGNCYESGTITTIHEAYEIGVILVYGWETLASKQLLRFPKIPQLVPKLRVDPGFI